jgi:hypothetical protein
MNLLAKLKPYAKAAIGALGLALAVGSQFVAPGSDIARYIALGIAVLTAFGIYKVPNIPAIPAAVTALKAAQAKRPGATT